MIHEEEHDLLTRLDRYLHSWGLREFHDESSYFAWQRTCLNQQQLLTLEGLINRRSKDSTGEADIDFYDVLAQPDILPILYSQRYDYYRKLGMVLYSRLAGAGRVLDFGCGVGLLTMFLAREFPDMKFVGIDRSRQSIALAKCEATKRQIQNIAFFHRHIPNDSLSGTYDVILSTQAVFQSESSPGLPSLGWQTFTREANDDEQIHCETRLGLMPRLDVLKSVLHPHGRMIFFEKTGHLGRRILFQRALSRRGLHLLKEPMPLSYDAIDEQVCDGPLYEVSQAAQGDTALWSEEPFRNPGDSLYSCGGRMAGAMGLVFLRHGWLFQENGKSLHWGEWKLSVGVWCQALAWMLFECQFGNSAILIGGIAEVPVLTKMFETFKTAPKGQVDSLIAQVWEPLLRDSVSDECPGYENHSFSAQDLYVALPEKVVEREFTAHGEKGKAMHLEFGQSSSLWYFYWANTFDQRQLVLVEDSGSQMLRSYFEDSLREIRIVPDSN